MFKAFNKLPLYGMRLDTSAVPGSAVHEIDFNDLSQVSARDFVWVIDEEQFVCCQVRSSIRHTPKGGLEVVSHRIEASHPQVLVTRSIEMGEKTNLYYIDPFFLHRHLTVSTHIPSAEIVQLEDKRGGS